MRARSINHESLRQSLGFIVASGRAVVLPLYMGTFERDDANFSLNSIGGWGTTAHRDLSIQWHKDLRRTVDYLETRDDIDTEALAFYGLSWGGAELPVALAVENRLKTGVAFIGGLFVTGNLPLPEVNPLNFLPRVTVPVLMLNGEQDVVFPLETSQKPFFELLGTPAEHKKHEIFPGSHNVPADERIRLTLNWLDRYLGEVQRRVP